MITMTFNVPPSTPHYKLIATYKKENEIYLALLIEQKPFNLKWNEVGSLEDKPLREYILSLKTEIESGLYEVK